MKKFISLFVKAKNVVGIYPTVTTIAFLLGICLTLFIDDFNKNKSYELGNFILTLALGISLFFGIQMLSQRIGKRWLLELGGLAILGLFYALLPHSDESIYVTDIYWIFPSFILSHLFVAFAPYLQRKSEITFWEYNKNLFINFILTLLFSGVLIGGIELAILAVDQLFNLDIDEELYAKTFLFLMTFGNTFIFLTFCDTGLHDLEKKKEYPIILKFFTQFILIPLLIIYVLILYAYSGKILINWELPRGWVSYLILAYSIVGILALLLVHPLKKEEGKSWVKVFSQVFYYTLIPLLILLYTAIFTRILEYGYTELRYFVLAIAVWLTTVVLYFGFIKKASVKFIPISLFVFELLAITLPYFNAFSVAKRSQKKELLKIIKDKKLVENNKFDFTQKLTFKEKREIQNKMDFLKERNEIKFLNQYMDEKTKKELIDKTGEIIHSYKFVNKFEIQKSDEEETEPSNQTIVVNATQNLVDIRNYDYQYKVSGYAYNNNNLHDIKINNDKFSFKKSSTEFVIILNDDKKIDLYPKIIKWLKDNVSLTKDYYNYDVPSISFKYQLEDYDIELNMNQIDYFKYEDGYRFDFYSADILFKKK